MDKRLKVASKDNAILQQALKVRLEDTKEEVHHGLFFMLSPYRDLPWKERIKVWIELMKHTNREEPKPKKEKKKK